MLDDRYVLEGSVRRAGDRLGSVLCVPASLDQPVGAAVIRDGGFGRVRKTIETPLNMILEERP
jgi:hypothetical protein